MFKNLDDHHIKSLKDTFSDLIIGRKLYSNKKVVEFFEGALSLKDACKVYIDIYKYKYRKDLFPIANKKMIEYFYKENILDDEDISNIDKYLWDYSFNDEDRENHYGDIDVEEVHDFIKDFISKKLYESGLNFFKESFYDIATGNETESNEIISKLKLSLHDHMGYAPDEENDEDDEDSESCIAESFYEIFQDDAKVYIFENYNFSSRMIDYINKSYLNSDSALTSEIYNEDENCMLVISDNQIYEGLNVEILMLILIEIINIRGVINEKDAN